VASSAASEERFYRTEATDPNEGKSTSGRKRDAGLGSFSARLGDVSVRRCKSDELEGEV